MHQKSASKVPRYATKLLHDLWDFIPPSPALAFFYANRDDRVDLCLQKYLAIFGRACSMKRLHELSLCSQLATLVAAFFGWLAVVFITKGSYKIKPWGYVFKNRCLKCGHKICTSQKGSVQQALGPVHTPPTLLEQYMFSLPEV